jgi:hypothetical protein
MTDAEIGELMDDMMNIDGQQQALNGFENKQNQQFQTESEAEPEWDGRREAYRMFADKLWDENED